MGAKIAARHRGPITAALREIRHDAANQAIPCKAIYEHERKAEGIFWHLDCPVVHRRENDPFHSTLERHPYDRRPRYEYRLTAKGAELVDLLMVMVGWGDKWLAGEAGPPVLYRHHACGEVSSVDLRCAHCDEPMHAGNVDLLPGPGAAA